MKRLLMVISLVSLLGSPTMSWTQDAATPRYREGFWIGFGLGPGHAQIDCQVCGPLPAGDPWGGGAGMSAYLALGGTPRPDLLIGGELNTYGKITSTSDRQATLGSVALVAQYYPASNSRMFLRGGAGIGHFFLISHYYLDSFMGRTASGLEGVGWAVQGGAGYDVLLGSRLALVPFVSAVQILAAGERDPTTGAAQGPNHPRYVHAGIGLHWY